MKNLLEIVEQLHRDALFYVFENNKSKHIIMVGSTEFHYLEPDADEFNCFTGVERIRRDKLPETIMTGMWMPYVCESLDEVLDIYNEIIEYGKVLSNISEAEIVD